jgi:hypothetical protein
MATDLLHRLEGVPKLLVDLVELCLADVEQIFAAFLFPNVSRIGC